MPKRVSREVANLDPNTIVGNSGSLARNIRATFSVAAVALSAVVSNSPADAHQWKHRKHSLMPHTLELNEVAHAVLEIYKMLNLNYRNSSSNGQRVAK